MQQPYRHTFRKDNNVLFMYLTYLCSFKVHLQLFLFCCPPPPDKAPFEVFAHNLTGRWRQPELSKIYAEVPFKFQWFRGWGGMVLSHRPTFCFQFQRRLVFSIFKVEPNVNTTDRLKSTTWTITFQIYLPLQIHRD